MPDRVRRIEAVRAGTPARVGDVTVLVIERVVVRSERAGRGIWVAASVEPHALVVRDPAGARVVELDGTAGSFEQLRERVPGLADLLR